MKQIRLLIALFVFSYFAALGQTLDRTNVFTNPSTLSPFRIQTRDGNQRIWKRTVFETNATGRVKGWTNAIIEMVNARKGFFDGEVLLVTRNFLNTRIVDDKLINQFEQAFGAEEVIERAILRGGESFARAFQIFKVAHDRGCKLSMGV